MTALVSLIGIAYIILVLVRMILVREENSAVGHA